ncbi:cell division ATP-binding protein FtsE [Fusibacter ferrireducens]|uniref:ATP-binding cassette domain-containing protein n=1 Tax=Fusibacter ferrireducens TaxID=2785058 RepID=A0ABR9ZQG4_9FIRM|nr:ATP-binding cassette domain-containing protein [Fusibacter ferrireducens]MBF4692707.1 ATP-binding cassette domain-containing protein [Fusibacter ferrireducens]
MSQPVIQAKNITLKYPNGNIALKDINFECYKGEIVFIVGPSGSGKTSLLKLLMGIEHPSQGELFILGERVQSANIRKIRQSMGPVFQEFRLLEGRTTLENVMMSMRFLDYSVKEMREQSEKALIRVGLAHKINSDVDHLSWGESQRVAIARAVARNPKLIIADEPTGNLDHANAVNILELLTSFKDEETTVLITTHATHLIETRERHHLITMNQGQLLWEKRYYE